MKKNETSMSRAALPGLGLLDAVLAPGAKVQVGRASGTKRD
jgi:hypothetical protein